MNRALAAAAAFGLVATSALAGGRATLSGDYVEARTAEVFTGGCIMGSEAETIGKQAVLAWRINQGSFNGVKLDGLSVVAALAGDRNLGIAEIGGDKARVRSAVFVDQRASAVQQMALVAMVNELSKGLVGEIVQVTPTAISFNGDAKTVTVNAGEVRLAVTKEMKHDPSCGAMQWFHPLSTVAQAEIGVADTNVFTGSALGARWSFPNRRSAFFATFSY